MAKMTLSNIYKSNNLEVLTFIDKQELVDNGVIFCVTKCEKVPVENSQFNINEQWQLTIVVPLSNGETRKYWATFSPNETRDDFMNAIVNGLIAAREQNMQAVHSCVLTSIPTKYDNNCYIINFSEHDCKCGMDN